MKSFPVTARHPWSLGSRGSALVFPADIRLTVGHGVHHKGVIESIRMQQYNNHPIYGIGVRGAGKDGIAEV